MTARYSAFRADDEATVNINVASSSDRVALASGGRFSAVLVTNVGTATAWIRFGDSSVAATTAASIPIPAGSAAVFAGGHWTHVAAIAAGSTGRIYFTPGEGL